MIGLPLLAERVDTQAHAVHGWDHFAPIGFMVAAVTSEVTAIGGYPLTTPIAAVVTALGRAAGPVWPTIGALGLCCSAWVSHEAVATASNPNDAADRVRGRVTVIVDREYQFTQWANIAGSASQISGEYPPDGMGYHLAQLIWNLTGRPPVAHNGVLL